MRMTGIRSSQHEDIETSDIRFPWIGASAPLIASIALWALTGSPISLLFGLLSPLTLVAHFIDARRTARRREARRMRNAAQAERQAEEERSAQRAAEIARATQQYPAAQDLAQLAPSVRRRHEDNAEPKGIRLGIRSDGHPLVVSAKEGLVVEGASPHARAVRRAIAAQVWWAMRNPHAKLDDVVTPRNGSGRWLVTVHDDCDERGGARITVVDRDAPGVMPELVAPDELSAQELASKDTPSQTRRVCNGVLNTVTSQHSLLRLDSRAMEPRSNSTSHATAHTSPSREQQGVGKPRSS